jgi:hypothetical protein
VQGATFPCTKTPSLAQVRAPGERCRPAERRSVFCIVVVGHDWQPHRALWQVPARRLVPARRGAVMMRAIPREIVK